MWDFCGVILSGVTPVCQPCRQFSSLVVFLLGVVDTVIQSLANASIMGQNILAFTLGFYRNLCLFLGPHVLRS